MDEFDNPLGASADGENAAGDGKESAASGASGGGGDGGGGSSEAKPSAAASGASFDDGEEIITFDTEDGNRSPGGTRIASVFAKGGHGLGEVAHGLGGLTGAATGGLTKGLGALQPGGTLFQELDEQELLDLYQTESSKPWYVIDPHGAPWKVWCFVQGVIACVVAAHPSACLPGCLRALPSSSLFPPSPLCAAPICWQAAGRFLSLPMN